MAAHNEAPCRVSAELRRKQYEDNQRALEETIPFDETDEEHLQAILGRESRLVQPMLKLLAAERLLRMTDGSFGVDHIKAHRELCQRIDILRDACRDEWRDQ